MARSTEHLPKYQPQDWSYYSPGTTDPTKLTKEELVKVINKAAKAANQRLRSLEKAGQAPASGAYKYAKSQRPQKFPRFKERVKPTDDQVTLRHMYMQLRNFMTMKTSTPTGVRAQQTKGYETAKAKGFTGSPDDWSNNVKRFFAAVQEGLLSSDVAYSAIVEGNTDVLNEQLEFWREQAEKPTRGESLLDYMDRLDREGKL